MIKEITSASNPILKELYKIKSDTRFRNSGGVVLIEGEKLIRDILQVSPLICLASTDMKWIEMFKAQESYLMPENLLKKITSTESPAQVVALVEMPKFGLPKTVKKLLVLDRIQDPGNLGTLIRTAYTLSWDGVFLLDGTVDPFNDKAIRAAKGATFHLPMMKGSILDLKKVMKDFQLMQVAAVTDGAPIDNVNLAGGIALILGNEGQGIADELLEGAEKVSIPMREGAESLNVAASGAILMYELRK